MRRRPLVRRLGGPALLAAVAALAAPGAAAASATQESVFMDDDLLLRRGPEAADRTLAELAALGVERVRVTVTWRALAPAPNAARRPASLGDPRRPGAYPPAAFDALDHLLRAARRAGVAVLLNVTGGAPLWATGRARGRPVSPLYRPSPRAFGAFVQMLGRRYDGTWRDENQGGAALPRVGAWSIWNEPNHGAQLQPQWERDRRSGRRVPASPRLYRGLLRAALAGLARSGHADDILLMGETAPRGNTRPGVQRHLRPVPFLRELFCLDARRRPLARGAARRAGCDFGRHGRLRASGYAHHPYSVTAPPARPSAHPEEIALGDSSRLTRWLDAAARAGRIARGLPVWYTEYGYQTNPPDPERGLPLEVQAAWHSEAEYLTWRHPRVVAHTHFLLRDSEPRRQYPPSDRRHWGTYQTGLVFADGRHKPAYAAYRLPLHAPDSRLASGEPLRLWGLVRPGANGAHQQVTVQWSPDGDNWDHVADVPVTDGRGYFAIELPGARSGLYRFLWRSPRPPRGASVLDVLAPAPASAPHASRPVRVDAG